MYEFDFSQSSMNIYDFINHILSGRPGWLIFFSIILIILYMITSYSPTTVNKPNVPYYMSGSTNTSSYFGGFELILWIIVLFLIFTHSIMYFFSIDIKTILKNIFTDEPELDIYINENIPQDAPIPEIKYEKQVFHIPQQKYTYEEAKALCKAYGGRLATYKEIENAYNNGAEWCSYGWSDGQMILYPTQEHTYNKLQKIKGHEHDCGRPGVNGGYISNPNARFGVNCYGYKPKITNEEEELMAKTTPYPLTKKDKKQQKLVKKYENKLSSIKVSPFNYNTWSEPLF